MGQAIGGSLPMAVGIVLSLAGTAGASTSGAPAAWVSWVKIALGVLLLLVAARQFRSRPHGDDQPQMPKWMATIDKTTPVVAVGLAAVLSGADPKNLLLADRVGRQSGVTPGW
jgi:Sap, sulfolipid-1-addressing protein